VENYAPLNALRALMAMGPSSTASYRRELAWHARDDLVPAASTWELWCRHVTRRLPGRLRRAVRPAAPPAEEVRARTVRQVGAPGASPAADARIDDERASSR
jgi:hypothetical protein